MLRYIEKVIVPYIEKCRESLPVKQCNQQALCIFDVFAAHRHQEVLDLLSKNNIDVVFVPACCTDFLQPLDLAINKQFKSELKGQFNKWYSAEVQSALEKGVELNEVKVDLRCSTLKPIHAKWLVNALDVTANKRDLIQ